MREIDRSGAQYFSCELPLTGLRKGPLGFGTILFNIAISRSCESSKNPNRQPNEDFSEMTSNLDGTKRSYEVARTRSEATKSIFTFKDNIRRKLSIRRNLKLSSCPIDCKNIEYNIGI